MKKLLILFVISLCFIFSCETTETPEEQKSSQKCIDENGPAFYLNPQGQCEWASALTIPNKNNYWSTKIIYSSTARDGFIIIHRENGDIKGWGKCYSQNTSYNGWTEGSQAAYTVGTFQWDLAPGNVKTLLISNQFNCNITMISNISANAGAYPTSFTATIVSATGSKSYTFNLTSGTGPF
jgi:hypothetical protein